MPLNVVAGLFTGFLLTVAAWFGAPVVCRLSVAGADARLLARRRCWARRSSWSPCSPTAPICRCASTSTGGARRRTLAVAAAALVVIALAVAPAPPSAPRLPTLTVLSVGEGAAALLQEPGGPTVLIDAGPAPLAACLRRHGVRRIDLLVLSHGHSDHTAGLVRRARAASR